MLQKDKRTPPRRKAAPKPAASPTQVPAPAAPTAAPTFRSTGGTVSIGRLPQTSPAAVAAAEAKSTPVDARPTAITPEERAHMISEAAYFRAQHRGFVSGDPVHDWAEAEAEIDAMLLSRR